MPRPRSSPYSPPADEPHLSRPERRARGVYYTPPEIVERLVELTLQRLAAAPTRRGLPLDGAQLRVLDPACGAGEFLIATARYLRNETPRRSFQLCGIDSDPAAVAAASERLINHCHVVHADALTDQTFPNESFDVILGNPPYVNIRQLAKSLTPDRVQALRERFHTARGNFDLYVPFVERTLELLKPGGRCGLVIPNKWATLDYARPLRELLLAETTIEHVVDLSQERVFRQASVYPHLLVFQKSAAQALHFVRFEEQGQAVAFPQKALSASSFAFCGTLDLESRVATRPLGELATLSCGTPGYSAQRIAEALVDVGQASGLPAHSWDFITSGNIDRYRIEVGNVRFLNQTYERPVLQSGPLAPRVDEARTAMQPRKKLKASQRSHARCPLAERVDHITDRQRKLFSSQKIVIAGMSQRLEAVWDERGLALGVQVFAITEAQPDPHYLLALLNSKLLTYLFRTRFAAKRLAGGYMAINKGQLTQLPIAVPGRTSVSHVQQLARLGQAGRLSYEDDAEIDRFVYRLYRLTATEIATVENHFAELNCRAA